MSDPKHPQIGDKAFDASHLTFVEDFQPGANRGAQPEKDGVREVIREINDQQAVNGERAGVTATDVTEVNDITSKIEQIDVFLPPAEKFVEMLQETRTQLVTARERKISTIADGVDKRAKEPRNADLKGAYQKTREYRSAIAAKAAKTRKKNKAETPA